MPSRLLLLLLALAALPCLLPAASDVVVTTSGDRLVGEIKSLDKDVLVFSTDYSDSDFRIKWEKVARIESDRQFLVETFAGERVSGSLKSDPAKKSTAQVGAQSFPLPDVALVQPFERSLWSRFDVGFDFGYSMTRANDAKQLTAGGNLAYRGERNLVVTNANAFFSRQVNAPRTRRWEVATDYKHLLGRNWYLSGGSDFLGSDEQKLDLRTTLSSGAGRYFFRSPSQYLGIGAGAAWTNEQYMDPTLPVANSAEAYGGFEYFTERLKFADLITRFTLYPSVTIPGRYRFNFKFDFDFNLPGDWYMRTGYYNNFDSQPPAGLSRNDYGWKNSFGLKF
jgi:hypothetical protein